MSDAGRGLFRDAALERLNSPEQLDQRIAVIPRGMSMIVLALAILMTGALTWAVFGQVPTKVLGRGVLLPDEEGNFAIASISAGLVLELPVKPGDRVKAGDKIARVEQRALGAQIDNTLEQIVHLQDNFSTLKAADAAQVRKSDETAVHQIAAIDEQIAAAQVRRERLRQLLAGYEQLRTKGQISQIEVFSKQDQLDQTMLDIANARARRIDIEATVQKKRDDLADMERQKQVEIDARKAEVETLRVRLDVGSVIKASQDGVIHEVRVGRGDVVLAGAVVATIGQASLEHIEVFALLRGEMRKRVEVGMEVHVVPDGTKKEQFGAMQGRVVSISEGDVSAEHVDQVLRNAQLTKTLIGESSPLLARIELVPNAGNPSGFSWWSGSGPPYRITVGTIASVDIIVAQTPPIALVIPAMRRLLSIGG